MEQSKLSYFVAKYASLDRDELGDLVARRVDLADEAIAALDQVLEQKGLTHADVYSPPPPKAEAEAKEEVAKETKLASELWRGGLATTCKYLTALICLAPAQQIVRALSGGAIWSGLIVLVVGYLGYKLGHSITKSICANGDATLAQKRRSLWWLFVMLWPLFFAVYAISSALFRGA
jgi:hypothetical protein